MSVCGLRRHRQADNRHPGRGQPGLERGVQPGRPDARGRGRRRQSACGTPAAAGKPPPSPKAARVHSVAFSPDGRTLAAGDDERQSACGTPPPASKPPPWPKAAPSTAWRSARTAGRSRPATRRRVGLWDTATGRQTATLAEGRPVDSVAFSPDGQTLAAGDINGDVGLWDTATGRRTATLGRGSPVFSVAFSPDGQTCSRPATTAVTSACGTPPPASKPPPSPKAARSTAWRSARDGQTLAAGDSAVRRPVGHRPRTANRHPRRGQRRQQRGVQPGRPDARGRGLRRAVGLWDTATGRRTATLAEGSTVVSVAFSPDGQTLAGGVGSDSRPVGHRHAGRQTRTLAEGSPVVSVAFSRDGMRTLAAGATTGSAMSACGPPHRRTPPPSPTAAPSGAWRSARTAGGSSRPGTVTAASACGTPPPAGKTATLAEGSPVVSVAFSPDGQMLAVWRRRHVGLWDTATGKKTATLTDGSQVWSVAFSRDGQTLAAGDSMGKVRIWDAADGQQLATLSEVGSVTSLAFSSNGPVLAIGGLNGDVVLLRENLTDLDTSRQLVCGKVQGNLTRAQWDDYAPGQPYKKTCP